MCILYHLLVLFVNVMCCSCQSSTLTINVVEITRFDDYTFVCTVTSAGHMSRWTYLSGSTGTSMMSFQNGTCTVSPSDSFLSDISGYSYTCNSTVHQVTLIADIDINMHNHIIDCRDVITLDRSGYTWIIKYVRDSRACIYCDPTITFDILDVIEGYNATFICRVSSDVPFVNWNVNMGFLTFAMGVQNGTCITSPRSSFLDNTSEYIYTCNHTVYQVTRLNVQRSEHNDIYMCTPRPQTLLEGKGSNWIINVKAPVTSVTMTPANYLINVTENTVVKFSCKTSTARPAASVYWYRHPHGNRDSTTQITENITTTTDYNDLSVTTSILRLVPTRQDNDTKIFCTANNSVNTGSVRSNMTRLLNVFYKAGDPYVHEGNGYRVIEYTSVTLSCSVKDGNPTPTLSWSCNNFSPTNQSTIKSNGNATTTLTWTVLRRHNGICTCTSKQTGFNDETLDVSLVVVYKAVILSYVINRLTDKVVTVNEGSTITFNCVTYGYPIPTMSLSHGTNVLKSITSNQLEYTLSNVSCQFYGIYSCAARNELNANTEVSSVDIFVMCTPRFSKTSERTKVSGIGEKVNITCDVISYPLPAFTWWQNANDQWKKIHNTERMSVESSGLKSTLTINKVDTEDFTSYKVIAENSIGKVELVCTLSHNGSPDVPTQLRYFEDLSTSASIKLAWNPGYNGGSTQIFYIKYKPESERSWKYKTVPDDGEQTQPFDLTGLKENTYYYVVVLASNKNGNSTESPLLIVNTKEIEITQTSNIGPMVGGIVGGSVVLAIVLFVVGIIIGRNMSHKGCMEQQSTTLHKTESQNDIPNESAADIQFDNIDRENEYEMIKQGNTPPMPYSTLQPDNNLTQDDNSKDDTYENPN